MVIAQGDVWWAELGDPIGSEAGYRRPVVVVQGDALNRTRIATVLCVPLTANPKWADALGNVLLRSDATGLPRDAVANVSLTFAVDRRRLIDWVGRVDARHLARVLAGIDAVVGR